MNKQHTAKGNKAIPAAKQFKEQASDLQKVFVVDYEMKQAELVFMSKGGLFDVQKMAYVQLRTSTMPNMARGFTMLRDGYGYVFGEPHVTDWDRWLPGRKIFTLGEAA